MTHDTPSGATPEVVLSIKGVSKTYAGGFTALKSVDLDIAKGEIFALLGPNGAGKTTLIGIICGLVNASSGSVEVFGHDIKGDFRLTRARIGLVPQEMSIDMFTKVKDAVAYSRGLFGKPADPAYIEQVLKDLSLWDKRDSQMRALSGGMKRRVMIAKALSHDPDILFLDEPTAGVDVELRQGMWQVVERLRQRGKTIILTTHYIQEAEEMADRVGVIRQGEIVLVEETATLMAKLGRKQLTVLLAEKLSTLPAALSADRLRLADDGMSLQFDYDTQAEKTGIASLLAGLNEAGVSVRDLETRQSSLEEIFVDLVGGNS
ncbi:ABC transporter ATP-binding protein [uncultured Maricaulis sp.]|jgi:ABC-2 type transport system ATP-binding protein|uniref:ABC transporter ATP-binding protein n=1 Tax=uncultured Maricaulis sp. TaxID=174710 RepID=UPI0030DA2C86